MTDLTMSCKTSSLSVGVSESIQRMSVTSTPCGSYVGSPGTGAVAAGGVRFSGEDTPAV
jgi:hypothetical protein